MKKVLVIEDDQLISEGIRIFFQQAGTETILLHDGDTALAFIAEGLSEVGVVLLDVMLPHADGFTICRAIRQREDVPIIFLTARGREEDILYGYGLGCDDYIVKPFSLAALHAKCLAIQKRAEGKVCNATLRCGHILLDTHTLQCYVDGQEVELTPKCYAILHDLMSHAGWVLDRQTLLDRVWGYDYCGNDRVVDNHIRLLRKALGKTAGRQIRTVIGKGYQLAVD